jgi:hypothetical protein
MTVVPHPPYFSLLPRLKLKLKGRHFETIEKIETEPQTVLNTPTEHDFQDAIKKWQKSGKRCIRAEGDYSRAMVASRPKDSFFDQMAAPVQEIMDGSMQLLRMNGTCCCCK